MGTYIIRRILQAIIVIVIVTALVFLVIRLLPGDPVLIYLTNQEYESYTPEMIAEIKAQFGLDKPLYEQYVNWISDIFHGDLGTSLYSKLPVTTELAKKIPVSIYLGFLSLIIGSIIGIIAGIWAAIRRGGWIDNLVTGLGNLGVAVPSFWLAILLIYAFGFKLGWLPIYGYTSPIENLGESLLKMVMPVFCACVPMIAGDVRMVRSSMLEVMRQDYVRTAWSKGLTEKMVVFRHAMKNGLTPVITLKGMGVATMLGGQVFIEQVFNIPGMGRLSVSSIQNQDYAVVQGILLLIATVMMLCNLLVDLSYGWLDPRVRFG